MVFLPPSVRVPQRALRSGSHHHSFLARNHAIPPFSLRVRHPFIRSSEQLCRILSVLRKARQSGTDGHVNRLPARPDRHGSIRHQLSQRFHFSPPCLDVRLGQNQHKFFAPITSRG